VPMALGGSLATVDELDTTLRGILKAWTVIKRSILCRPQW